MKGTTPYGQLPVMVVDGQTYAQSEAMLRYVCCARGPTHSPLLLFRYMGSVSGMYPRDDLVKCFRIDEMIGLVGDLQAAVRPSMLVGRDPSLTKEQKAAKTKELREAFCNTELPKFLGHFERKLKAEGSGFLVGRMPTIADCTLLVTLRWLTRGILDHVPVTCLAAYPEVSAFKARMEGLPRIKSWYANGGKMVY